MKVLGPSILGLTGLATFVSAIPIRIVTIDAVAPLSPSTIDVGYVTHSPSPAAAVGNENGDRNGKANNGLAPDWLKEFMDKYAPTSAETDTYSHPHSHSHGYKWSTNNNAAHPHGGPNDHSLSAGTDVSRVPIPEWMYVPPLSEVSPPPPSSSSKEEDGSAGEMMLVTRPDGVVVYEFVPAVKTHGGVGCVFRSFRNMVSSLSTHQLVVFLITTSLMLLVILRLAFLIALLIHRAHLWANECPGEAAARRRRHLAREAELVGGTSGGGASGSKVENVEDVDPVPAYTVDEQEEGEKDTLLPAYVERA